MNTPIRKPMLAGKCESLSALTYPVLVTPKLDGIRCLMIDGRAMTRAFKPIPNDYTRQWLESNLPSGLDGELIVRNASFSDTSGAFARQSGQPDFAYCVFDYVSEAGLR